MDSLLSPRRVIIISDTNQNSGKNIQKSEQHKQLIDDKKMEEQVAKNKSKLTRRKIEGSYVPLSRHLLSSDSDEDKVEIKKKQKLKTFDSDDDDSSLGSNPAKKPNHSNQDISGIGKLEGQRVELQNLDVILEGLLYSMHQLFY
ncbi:uncharacterized protein LOC112906354 [Agrilus planipennis]|uniref:Uncharacterized protein LOC112906354 n=1 Tax=Agrilus planipennis TaxID=224129 RepID=A0A7F5RJA2_AGRPL|nr:uncharacterized protein LOC112906354 [Agrilus planipennis]